jgi:glycosyltransferase involved in cell wall biosynthesis
VIYDAHEDLPRQIMGKHWIPKPLRRAVSFISEKVENHYAQKVSGIVTATPFIADRFRKINRNVANINNYPLLDEFAYIERKPSDERLVCYLGGITSGRGIFEMVRAMESVDGKLLLAGNFSNLAEREKAQNLPGWGKVVELGFCDREKVKKILASAKVGLVLFHPTPNHTNAQPNKLFEYMAAGLPVIASDFALWKEIVDTAECGKCVNPLNAEEIARAINWMLDHPDEANKMGEAGKAAVRDRFNWAAEEKKMLEFYHHML